MHFWLWLAKYACLNTNLWKRMNHVFFLQNSFEIIFLSKDYHTKFVLKIYYRGSRGWPPFAACALASVIAVCVLNLVVTSMYTYGAVLYGTTYSE